ncbi:MAG: leucine-rich repeat domain-containing protein, partial [Ruminiclostridium sp.]
MKKRIPLFIALAITAALAIAAAAIVIISTANTASAPAAMLSAAERYLRDLDYEQAIIEFQRIIEIDPNNAEAYEGLIEAYEALGEQDKAEEIRKEAYEVTGKRRFKGGANTAERTTTAAETSTAAERTTAAETTTSPETTENIPETVMIGGVEYSTELTELDLSSKGLTDDDIKNLKYMTRLTYLDLKDNQISNLSPLSGLTRLTYLRMDSNQIR